MIPKYMNNNIPKSEQTKDASKYPQGYFKPKPCGICDLEFQPYAPSEKYCSDVCKNEAHFSRKLDRLYGISVAKYKEMYAKCGGTCHICGGEGFSMSSNRNENSAKLAVDHCHATGKVRGLLCHNCNRALGLMHDNKERITNMLKYLGEQNAKTN